jgi:hypothetical protein
MEYTMFKVYNQYGTLVSCTDHDNKLPPYTDRSVIVEGYAKGCGWPSVADMREYYPVDTYIFIYSEE